MTYVEQAWCGFPWAEPEGAHLKLKTQRQGECIEVVGRQPFQQRPQCPTDVVRQYDIARKARPIGKKSAAKDSPHIRFANAHTEKKLIAFVQDFGPVVAKFVTQRSLKENGEPVGVQIVGLQNLEELRKERVVYAAAFNLVLLLNELSSRPAEEQAKRALDPLYRSKEHMVAIADHVTGWPTQWRREQFLSQNEPAWHFNEAALKHIQDLSALEPNDFAPLYGPSALLCTLLNVFRLKLFPTVQETYASTYWGIRPLLYSILRRELLHSHETGICANSQCRQFFEIERSSQRYCSPECSQRQRQREHWQKRGSQRRSERRDKALRGAHATAS